MSELAGDMLNIQPVVKVAVNYRTVFVTAVHANVLPGKNFLLPTESTAKVV